MGCYKLNGCYELIGRNNLMGCQKSVGHDGKYSPQFNVVLLLFSYICGSFDRGASVPLLFRCP